MQKNKRFIQRSFSCFQDINGVSEEVLAQKRILKDLKGTEKFEVENFAI